MADIIYTYDAPSAQAFAQLREDCGWGRIGEALAQKAIENSLVFVSAYTQDALIGFGRVIGDGALNYYIQDLIVVEAYQGQGVGKTILGRLLESIDENAQSGASIGLMAAVGREAFYIQFGFEKRPNMVYGAGMTRNVGKTVD
ncbi:MAG: GNAT family N-acetyltransferase [Robiginitomaculum sp.]|nr:MAG: GNAT family N-acetyltransferase [Robiginitomaculum sp.]